MKYKKGTFVIVPNINELKGKKPELQSIFLRLCCYANEEGGCFPSRTRLAKECGMNIKTIDKYMKELVDEKFIDKKLRKVKDSNQNLSNYYNILIKEDYEETNLEYPQRAIAEVVANIKPYTEKGATIENDITQGSEQNSTVTISNITIPNITISTELTLPTHRGKLAHQRLDSIYIDLYYNLYLSKPSVSDIGKRLKIFKDLLGVYTELQIAMLLITFFNWNGMDNNSSKDRDFFTNNAHAIHLFKYNINKFELYIKNVSGYKVEFENSNKDLLEFIGNWIINLTNKI